MPRCSVALLVNFVPPYRVALFRALEREVRRLTVLVSTEMEADRPWQAETAGLDIRRIRSFALPYRRHHPDGFSEALTIHFSWDLLPRLASLGPDVVISSEFGLRSLQAGFYRWLAPLFGRRTRLLVWATVSEQTERGRGGLRMGLRRLIARMADGAVTNGASGARYLESIGFVPKRIFQIHQSTDLERFDALPPAAPGPDGTIRLVSVGSLIPRKGLMPFLERLAAWCRAHPERRLHWRLVGDGPERAKLEAAELPANLEIELAGNRDYGAVPDLLTDRDLFVFPTLADEWGLVVNEAMAAGLPVFGSHLAQAAEEMIAEGENGWLFDPTDGDGTDAALTLALGTDAPARAAMSEAARKTARLFSHENTLRRMTAAIDGVWDR
ncbi:glycosyltransferase family 4 protein [Nisaea acidiphila]|uniref:Glycosyltransferase family 4 protein n=1 Tax=Nisaea acidiphila TaxID=1862145 RepID=A0A9J7AXN3_9PROT|nr:glycosyltransferase family 4 protein [Nisaea acidiphila]UUX52048.1 glycosyltransferase family 4 protein [Nisaea acidiphila]